MSFSGEVKEELTKQIPESRHCQLAELSAMIHFAGRVAVKEGRVTLEISLDRASIAKKCYTLLKRAFSCLARVRLSGDYGVVVEDADSVHRILQAMKLIDVHDIPSSEPELVDGMLVQRSCCKRAYIRGAFLVSGSMSDPQKSYHFEIVCSSEKQAEQLCILMREFVPDAKVVRRKKYYIVYIKEGAQIVDILNVMEAYTSLMDLENVRIVKEMRNTVNRKVNCETANINKTVGAAVRQIEDIRLIERKLGLSSLADNLREIAAARLEHPDTPLKELGEYLSPPVGKSGVNHRLRKLSEIAEQLREEEGA